MHLSNKSEGRKQDKEGDKKRAPEHHDVKEKNENECCTLQTAALQSELAISPIHAALGDKASSVHWVSREEVRIAKKKTSRQHYNVRTPGST